MVFFKIVKYLMMIAACIVLLSSYVLLLALAVGNSESKMVHILFMTALVSFIIIMLSPISVMIWYFATGGIYL